MNNKTSPRPMRTIVNNVPAQIAHLLVHSHNDWCGINNGFLQSAAADHRIPPVSGISGSGHYTNGQISQDSYY